MDVSSLFTNTHIPIATKIIPANIRPYNIILGIDLFSFWEVDVVLLGLMVVEDTSFVLGLMVVEDKSLMFFYVKRKKTLLKKMILVVIVIYNKREKRIII